MALAKYVAHIEEMWEKVTKEKIRRTLQLERDLQHKIEEFDLGLGSLVLVKNSAIEISANKKIKPRYLGPMYHKRSLTNLWWVIWYLNSSKKQSLDNDKRCC